MYQCKHGPGEWFTAERAAKLSGVTLVMLNYLCRQGIVEPTCPRKRGHGSQRHYTFGDLIALRLVAKLSKAGVSVSRLKSSFQRLRTLHPDMTVQSLSGKRAVTDGCDIYLRSSGVALERASDGQFAFAFVVELDRISNEVADEMQKTETA